MCSLPMKHRGDHKAKNLAGVVVHRWATKVQNERNRPDPAAVVDAAAADADERGDRYDERWAEMTDGRDDEVRA